MAVALAAGGVWPARPDTVAGLAGGDP